MKKGLLLFSSLFLIGCGGGSVNRSDSSENLDKVDIVPLVKDRYYYEEDLCKDPEFTSYLITDDKLTLKSYSDSNYSDLVESISYPVISFEDDEMKIKKDGDLLTCAVGYEITDRNEVTMLELDCVDANDTESTNTLFFFAYDTKESAHKNRNECK